MLKKTHLANSLDKTEYESQYDDRAKELASNKQVLARILKHVVSEFKTSEIQMIEDCIEGNPEVSTNAPTDDDKVHEKITGINTESTIIDEGTVRYDIRFFAITPEKKERIKIILNVELQKEYRVKYHLVTRGIFYCARMISEQLNTEFTADNYDDIKKVYSIWLCMDTPEKIANTITEYTIARNNLYGTFDEDERYDLLSVIMVRLSGMGNDESGNKLHKMLTTLFSNTMNAELKKEKLENEFGMRMSEEFKGRIDTMCNLSQLIKMQGIEQGMQLGKEAAQMQVMTLIQRMTADGRLEEIPKLASDSVFYKEMIKKYSL